MDRKSWLHKKGEAVEGRLCVEAATRCNGTRSGSGDRPQAAHSARDTTEVYPQFPSLKSQIPNSAIYLVFF